MQVPYRDNPLSVAAEVQIGGACGSQPQRGVEFGACAEVPNLRGMALQKTGTTTRLALAPSRCAEVTWISGEYTYLPEF